MNTPFFPAWRPKLAALGNRAASCRKRSPVEIEAEFVRFLPTDMFKPTAKGVGSRIRIFPLARIFWCFIWQALQPNTSCRAVVRKVQAQCETSKFKLDESNSAYCQARARLPVDCLQQALMSSAKSADDIAGQHVEEWDRPIKVVDATSFRLPDTPANRKKYGYPSGQKKGCGFPVMKALAIFSLSGGTIHHINTGPCHLSEQSLFKPLWTTFLPGDIVLGDRVFGTYPVLASLPQQQVDVVARLNQCRKLDLRQAKKLGPRDWLVTLHKSYICSPYMTAQEWEKLPEQITVRIIHYKISIKGFRTRKVWLVTTLLDPGRYSADALADIYFRRWEMEISFRDLKTTMGMEMLRCRSPNMIRKEILVFIIAHNLLRALITEASRKHDISRQRISFKGTIDIVRSFLPAMMQATSISNIRRLHARMLEILAKDAIPLRPYRSEPRAVKQRPKPYSLLTKPRHIFKELPHRGNPRRKQQPLS
jgi:hypothetical protein